MRQKELKVGGRNQREMERTRRKRKEKAVNDRNQWELIGTSGK